MKLATRTLLALILSVALLGSALAASQSAVGYWQTIDSKTGKVSSIIKIEEEKNRYVGKVYKSFPKNVSTLDSTCKTCNGVDKNKSTVGMTIISNMRYENGVYVDGNALDPITGKKYKAKMWLSDNGRKLNLRGYIGFSLLGKTVVWVRGKTDQVGR